MCCVVLCYDAGDGINFNLKLCLLEIISTHLRPKTSSQKYNNNKINIQLCQTEHTFNFIVLMYFKQRDVLYQVLLVVVWQQIVRNDIHG
jgi:hypothetical protein